MRYFFQEKKEERNEKKRNELKLQFHAMSNNHLFHTQSKYVIILTNAPITTVQESLVNLNSKRC